MELLKVIACCVLRRHRLPVPVHCDVMLPSLFSIGALLERAPNHILSLFLGRSVPNGYVIHFFSSTREREGERLPKFEQGHFMICVQTGLAKTPVLLFLQ